MAVESIGALFPTKIPGYADAADIQAALRAYHYGSYAYDTANTSTGALEANSIAKFLFDIQTDIIDLENRPSSGGEVNTTQPAATSFTPAEVPDGFIWVDEDGSIGGAPTGATAVFTNSAPTSAITTGTIWVDKDATSITENPFIPQAVINAKGDLLVGTANDTASVLSVGTTGFFLKANSSTTSGLEWAASTADIDGVTAGTGLSGGGTSGTVTLSINTAVTADLTTAQTLTNKTLTTPKITLSYSAKTDHYTFVDGDQGNVFSMNNAAAREFRIPTDATFDFAIGTQFNGFWITGAGIPAIVAVTPGTTTVISTGAISASPKLRAANSMATAIKIAANSWIVIGDIS